MSVVATMHQAREAEAFYRRWGPDVFAFCRLFLGDEAKAEALVPIAFLSFYRESSALPVEGEVPTRLVGHAFQAMQPCGPVSTPAPPTTALEKCVLELDCRQRAAFILRSVLGMSWPGIASAMSSSVEETRQTWLKGMLKVRELLPRDFFDR